MRLIDADALTEKCGDWYVEEGTEEGFIGTVKQLIDAQPEQRWIPCGKCIHADGKHRWCKILDRSINEDYFCCWAEPYREEGD